MFEPEIVVLPTARAVAEALADRTATALRAALAREPRVTLCLTGGSTPEPAYRRLAAADGLDWSRVHVFWSDERSVPPDDPASNYGMARRALLDPAGGHSPGIRCTLDSGTPAEGAVVYEQALVQFFGEELHFDVLHLGMGADGHIASLFPGSDALAEAKRRVRASEAPPGAPVRERLTLTLPALATADLTLVAVSGAAKRDAFQAVLAAYDEGAGGPPAARLQPAGPLVWLVDRDVAQGPDDPPAGPEPT